MRTIDQYAYQSRLRTWNATGKFAYAMCTLLLCLAGSRIPLSLIVLAGNTLLIAGFGKTPVRAYGKALRIPAAFLLLSTATILFHVQSVPMNGFAIPVGSWYITNSTEQLLLGIRLMTTAFGCVSSLYVLSFTTPMTDILRVLRQLKCPALIVELMLLIYRFIFLLQSITHQIQTSQQSRLGNRDFRTQTKSFGQMGSALFILAMKRSTAIYDAMESRCYQGMLHVLEETYPFRTVQFACYLLLIFVYSGVYIAARVMM